MLYKLPLAEGAREEAAAILMPLQIQDECSFQLSLGEDHFSISLVQSLPILARYIIYLFSFGLSNTQNNASRFMNYLAKSLKLID